MNRKQLARWGGVLGCILGTVLYGGSVSGAAGAGVFRGFTDYIYHQIALDMESFVEAESCTQWFYRKLQQQPRPPKIQMLSFVNEENSANRESCLSHYPTGLDGAREAFSKTQSALSLSLTFYQYALVGDADDDGEYSLAELGDIFESFGLAFQTGVFPSEYLASLTHTFDSVRGSGKFDLLTKGMEQLYKKGYRLSPTDKVALNRVTQ